MKGVCIQQIMCLVWVDCWEMRNETAILANLGQNFELIELPLMTHTILQNIKILGTLNQSAG
jgi:hypothetical protein